MTRLTELEIDTAVTNKFTELLGIRLQEAYKENASLKSQLEAMAKALEEIRDLSQTTCMSLEAQSFETEKIARKALSAYRNTKEQ